MPNIDKEAVAFLNENGGYYESGKAYPALEVAYHYYALSEELAPNKLTVRQLASVAKVGRHFAHTVITEIHDNRAIISPK